MPKRIHELLWQLREDTVDEISRLRQSEMIDAWLDNQSALTAAYATDLDSLVLLLEEELSARGFSLKTH
jgi:hypothetical protein